MKIKDKAAAEKSLRELLTHSSGKFYVPTQLTLAAGDGDADQMTAGGHKQTTFDCVITTADMIDNGDLFFLFKFDLNGIKAREGATTVPVFVGHQSDKIPIGNATDMGVEGGKFVGKINISHATQQGTDVVNTVRDGNLTGVSGGYYFKDFAIHWDDDDDNDQDFSWVEVLDSDLYELSLTGVPADNKARIIFEKQSIDKLNTLSKLIENQSDGELTMSGPDLPVENSDAIREDSMHAERERVTRIRGHVNNTLAALQKDERLTDRAKTLENEAVESGKPFDAFAESLLVDLNKTIEVINAEKAVELKKNVGTHFIDVSKDGGENAFNIAAVTAYAKARHLGKPVPKISAGVEDALSATHDTFSHIPAALTGFPIPKYGMVWDRVSKMAKFAGVKVAPRDIVEMSFNGSLGDFILAKIPNAANLARQNFDQTVGTDTAGGHLVQDTIVSSLFAPHLFAATVLDMAGVQTMTVAMGDVILPYQSGTGTPSQRSEDAAITVKNLTFGQRSYSPLITSHRFDASYLALNQPSVSIGEVIMRDIQNGIRVQKETLELTGDGTGNNPTGLLTVTGASVLSYGTNGDQHTPFRQFTPATQLERNNHTPPFVCIQTPESGRNKSLQVIVAAAGGAGGGLLQAGGMVNGCMTYNSNLLPQNLTKGTGSALHAELWVAPYSVIKLDWGLMNLTVDPYTDAPKNNVRFVAHDYWNLAIRYPTGIVQIKDIDNSVLA